MSIGIVSITTCVHCSLCTPTYTRTYTLPISVCYSPNLDRSVGVAGAFPPPPPATLEVDSCIHSDRIFRNVSQVVVTRAAISNKFCSKRCESRSGNDKKRKRGERGEREGRGGGKDRDS